MKNRSWLVVRYRLEAYATLRRCQVAAGTRKRLQEDFHTSACQSGEQSSIGFQPVSSVDYGWLAVLSGPTIADCLNEKSKLVGGSIQAISLCYFTPLHRCCGFAEKASGCPCEIAQYRPLTLIAVAEYLQLPVRTVRDLCRRKKISESLGEA